MLAYIAEKLHSNIRQLEGIIKRISATHLLDGAKIDMDLVRDRLIGCPYRKDAVAEVLRRYAGADGVYGITLDEMVDTIVE